MIPRFKKLQDIPKGCKIFQKISKDSKRFQKILEDIQRIQKSPKHYKGSKRVQNIPKGNKYLRNSFTQWNYLDKKSFKCSSVQWQRCTALRLRFMLWCRHNCRARSSWQCTMKDSVEFRKKISIENCMHTMDSNLPNKRTSHFSIS